MSKDKTLTNSSPNKLADLMVEESRFQIGKQIGAGTFGKVFQAMDTKTGQKVAIKEAFQDKKYKNRELQVLIGLKNDNIVELKNYYFVTKKLDDKYLYISMDLYQANLQSLLKQYRKQKKMLQPIQVKILAFQIFKALYYLKVHHQQQQQKKVCHRDLKPPNILINPHTLELRICDFGSAKKFNQIEKNVTYICSRYYRAPQLLFDYGMYGTEVDVWSAGCIFVELLTREPIFPGDSAVEQLIQIIKIIGVPDEDYMRNIANDYKQSIEFPNIPHTKWQRILRKINPDPQLISIISNILVFDIKKRLTPFQILKHPYFHQLSNPENKKYVQKLPNLLNFQKMEGTNNREEIQILQNIYNKQNSLKQITSIEKDLVSSAKLQTGDSTPLSVQEEEPKKGSSQGTKDTISSKKSIAERLSVQV